MTEEEIKAEIDSKRFTLAKIDAQRFTLAQRIHAVMKEVAYVQKDTRIDGKYNAVTHDQLISVLRPSMVKHGILLMVTMDRDPIYFPREDGSKQYRAAYQFRVRLINVDCADDTMSVVVPATGLDSGDKGDGKAITYATKAALLKLFMLETGENDESRSDEPVDDSVVDQAASLILGAATLNDLKDAFKNAMALVKGDNNAEKTVIRLKESRKKVIEVDA
jgi:hypothetical protein